MKRLFGLSAIAFTLVASACAAEGDPDILELAELDDRLLDYPFAPQVSDIVEVDSMEVVGSVRVRVAPSKDHLIVVGPLQVLDVPDEGMMFIHLEATPADPAVTEEDVTVEAPAEGAPDGEAEEEAVEVDSEIPEVDAEELESDDMRFVMFTEDEEGAWTPIMVLGEYSVEGIPTVSQLISFDMVAYSPEHKRMVGYHGSIGQEFSGAMDVPTTGRIGIFALPEVTAGDLVGKHRYTMQALCGEKACKDPVAQGPRADVALSGGELDSAGALDR